jgi:hypothetical protein
MHLFTRKAWLLMVPFTMLLATACGPNLFIGWRLGTTHGVVIEPTVGRAGLNIYRAPRNALYQIYKAAGIQTTEDILWHYGQPPTFTLCVPWGNPLAGAAVATAPTSAEPDPELYATPDPPDTVTQASSDSVAPAGAEQVSNTCISTSAINSAIKAWIFNRDADLVDALKNAQSNGDCLNLTVLSAFGLVFTPNWSHKGISCNNGSIPAG